MTMPTPDPESDQPADLEAMSFEDSLDALERIIQRIESGETSLEGSLAAYQQGEQLIRRCRELLFEAEQRIETIRLDDLPPDPSEPERS
ncbi:MAG: exodeoxyribonuclease VII small subunit [Planctomycetota bacterium]|nr:exodeoxyribonuclease VII small subunit [Planctomycetota bacterium]MEC8558774.1 exodeoxyribonuclease VII small subunit [Planctomycetota bacterium]MEC8733762.1 exodeoxyribonuclease VII small subunit [Planctomycetota bacterium]MEC8818422.1 exodeoxyribonuclease VII small subunit [Planctomycetota bacterium]MEC9158499.1 exodeoxyribonuclease VII small subunit [Planctomycetota bacterium]